MNSLEKTFKAMEHDCITFGNTHESVLYANPIIKQLFDSLITNSHELDDAVELQKRSDPSGHFTNKKNKADVVINRFYSVCRSMTLYAKQSKNPILQNDVDITESTFHRADHDKLLLLCSLIIKRGREYIDALYPYGITADLLNELEAEAAHLKALPDSITAVTSDHKIATKSIERIIADARIILDHLDDAFDGMVTDQKLLDGWFDARKIKGRHHPKKSGDTPTTPTNE